MTRLAFHPIFESYALVGLLALGLLWMLLIRPADGRLTSRRRWTLLGLRIVLIGGLLLAMLRPSVVGTVVQRQSSVFLLLFDQSQSMQQPAATSQVTRWEKQSNLLVGLQSELAQFDDSLELKTFGYDQQLRDTPVAGGVIDLPAQPRGDATDISGSLLAALQNEVGQRIAGVLLLGDGAQSAIQPAAELQQTSHELARLGVPLYSVTFGASGETSDSRDIAVESMPDQFSVFVKNELTVEAAVRVRGFVNKEIDVELVVEDAQGNQQTFGPQSITASRDNELVPVRFPFLPNEPGEFRISVRAATEPGELLSDNNVLAAFLTVLEGGLRVLYLYGELQGEQQHLRQSINAAPDMQIDDQFVSVLDRARWPIDLNRWIATNSYDAFMIESVDVTAFSPADLQKVSDLVGAGAGFMMLGGYSSFGAGGYQNSPWSDLLPVEMSRFERQDLDPNIPISRDLHLWRDLALRPARPHALTQLAAGVENAEAWSRLPTLLGANKLQPKPASQLLLETGRSEPILVAGTFGRGRVLAFAGNTTSRWWRYGYAAEHRRFWRQVVLWLARRDDLTRNDVWIDLDQRRFSTGQPIEFRAGATDALGQPLRDVTLQARLVDARGQSQAIRLTQARESYRGLIESPPPGDLRIELTAALGVSKIGDASARIQVLQNDIELSNPIANHQLMARLANATQAAGGRAVAQAEVSELLSRVRQTQQQETLEIETRWELGDNDGSAWLLFLAMVGLASSEWICRKRWGLV